MNLRCPKKCPQSAIKYGKYWRKSDSKSIQRYRCSGCGLVFSQACFSPCYRQKKRRVNPLVYKLLSSGISQRRCALVLKIHPTTVARKLVFLAGEAQKRQEKFLETLREDPVEHLQIDDLITSHHTKLKPLSVSVAIDAKRRKILGVEVSQIPAFGHLAKISRRKYGKRPSSHREKLENLFKSLTKVTCPYALVESDEHKLYPLLVNKYLPHSTFKQYKSERGCVVGQGELKKVKRDPLFKINHTLAMLRANINRLIRRTWCTTKDPRRLHNHLVIYSDFHNRFLV